MNVVGKLYIDRESAGLGAWGGGRDTLTTQQLYQQKLTNQQNAIKAFKAMVINDPVRRVEWPIYAKRSIDDSFKQVAQGSFGSFGTFAVGGPGQVGIPGTNLTANISFDNDPHRGGHSPYAIAGYGLRYYIMAPDGSAADVYPGPGEALTDLIRAGKFTLHKGRKIGFINATLNLPHNIGHALMSAAKSPELHKALTVLVAAPLTVGTLAPSLTAAGTAATGGAVTAAAPTAAAAAPTAAAAITPTAAITTGTATTGLLAKGASTFKEATDIGKSLYPVYQAVTGQATGVQTAPSEIGPAAPVAAKPALDIKSVAIPVGIALLALFAMQ
jgi:hypothetical protein